MPGSPTETLVDYPPTGLPQALDVLGHLSGAVMLQVDPSLPAGTVQVDAGSLLTVTRPRRSDPDHTSGRTAVDNHGRGGHHQPQLDHGAHPPRRNAQFLQRSTPTLGPHRLPHQPKSRHPLTGHRTPNQNRSRPATRPLAGTRPGRVVLPRTGVNNLARAMDTGDGNEPPENLKLEPAQPPRGLDRHDSPRFNDQYAGRRPLETIACSRPAGCRASAFGGGHHEGACLFRHRTERRRLTGFERFECRARLDVAAPDNGWPVS